MMNSSNSLTVVMPTYRRETVLLEAIRRLLALTPPPAEIVVVDQTEQHASATAEALTAWDAQGCIRWLRRAAPSIPEAMNAGLLAARQEVVLFLDDDIRPDCDLVGAHLAAHGHNDLIAGQVLQPREEPEPLAAGEGFRFNSTAPTAIGEFMGGNFSIKREVALALGGFDENFIGAAYRFEAEFAHRYTQKHGPIRFEPAACIHHLQVPSGGTRAHGHHLRTLKPAHSVGEYYYLLRVRPPGWWMRILRRPLRAIRTRHHLRQPWWIPLTLLAEGRGFARAAMLAVQGPKYIGRNQDHHA
jgi:glycosyltransferase involved in cell wall biosynthesis